MTTTSNVGSTSSDAIYAALNGSSSKTSTTTDAEGIQNYFLTLLTTQLQNQDPLNPMDSSAMTSQLAQISTVEGVTTLNTTLTKLMDNLSSSEAVQAADLVGHAVLVDGSKLDLSSSVAAGGVELGAAADSVTVTISDSNGDVVNTLDLGKLSAGVHEFAWDGTNQNGTKVADGEYTVKVTATADKAAVTASTLQLGTVNYVVTGGSEVQVDVGSLGRVAVSDIKLIL